MRVLALAVWRLRGAAGGRVLVGPAVLLAAVELVVLGGGRPAAAVAVVTAVTFAVPVLAWAARQVLDAVPDDEAALSVLAVGGRRRADLAAVLAACGLTVPVSLLCGVASLLRVDEAGVTSGAAAGGTALALAAGLVAAAVGAAASRAVAGTGAGPVLVLVAAPVAFAVAGLWDSPVVWVLVPRLDEAVRAGYADRLVADGLPAVGQAAVWACVVLGVLVLRVPRR